MTCARHLIAALLVVAATTGALAQDWPQWRGPNRDGRVAAFRVPEKWPASLGQKWKTTVGPGDATPALVGDKLYVFSRQGGEEVILCLDAATGKESWKHSYATEAVTGAAARHPGPRGSLAVADGKVVALGACGVLSCLDASSGKLLWRTDEPKGVPQFFTGMSPLIVDGLCVAHMGGKDNGAIVALDLATGSVKWKCTGHGPAYASPVVMTADGVRQIVLLTDKSAMGLAVADGKVLWQTSAVPQGRFYNSATPVVDGQTVFITGQGKGTMAIRVEKQADGFAAKEIWNNPDLGTGFSTPVLKDGFLYGFSDKGNLFCMSAATGKTAWVDATKRGQGNFAAIVDAGTVIVALPSSGELVVFKPSDKEFTEVAKIKVSDTATYAHPVLAGNRIFVRDQETVALLAIE